MPKYVRQRGTLDVFDNQAVLQKQIEDVAASSAQSFNFYPIYTPTFEATSLFTRSTGETSDIVTKEMYTFLDKGGRDISLRPEGTAGIIRAVIENKLYAINDLPLKYFYCGPFFRYERPQVGRYREFTQFGVEVVGTNSYLDDAEVILLVADILKRLEIKDYKIRINTFGNKECREKHRDNVKAFFSKHLDNLCQDCKERFEKNPLRILDCKVDKEYIETLTTPVSLDSLGQAEKETFNKILAVLKANNINYEIDKYLVRGLDYYTGMIFEVDITLKDGKVLTIGGGGRYSNLVKELDGPDLDCVGFGIGISRILVYLEELYGLDAYKNRIDYYVMPLGENAKEMATKIATSLRNKNYNVALETRDMKIGNMLKYASKHGFAKAVMIGDDEIANNQIKIKDLQSQEQYYMSLAEILEV